MQPPANEIAKLAGLIGEAEKIVAFTGAGISTECGIPDFRSPGGLWTRYRPIEFSDFLASAETRLEAWRRYFKLYDQVRGARPGRGHVAIAQLVRSGKASHVITQNIDNLHLESGVPAGQILELHGNGTFARCLSCGLRHELDWARSEVERLNRAPQCIACGGMVKTATISFGQPMPEGVMAEAHAATEACDLFLAVGSSLTVYPAATLPMLAQRWGARLAVINNEPTDFDAIADLVIHWDAGDTLARAVR
ncbi:MAG TPA: Sir2 family NAD-dependent protein deacetylase [Aestuariivirgaceae bacterium]|jgi:NAD-dependent deacetylase